MPDEENPQDAPPPPPRPIRGRRATRRGPRRFRMLLFGVLAAVMWVTRRVDWYELGASLK